MGKGRGSGTGCGYRAGLSSARRVMVAGQDGGSGSREDGYQAGLLP